MQWLKVGYFIDDCLEILVLLFNLGYCKLVFKVNLSVGGLEFKIWDKDYIFGLVVFDFYYFGELEVWFFFCLKYFDFDEKQNC